MLDNIADLVRLVRLTQFWNISSMTAQGGLTHFSMGGFIIGERLSCARHLPTIVAQMPGEGQTDFLVDVHGGVSIGLVTQHRLRMFLYR